MKIVGLKTQLVAMKLKQPYTVAYETFDSATNVLLQIETNTSVVGYGCCAPDVHVTGEVAEQILVDLENNAAPAMKGSDPLRIMFLMNRMKELFPQKPTTRAGIDLALHDILGKSCQIPLWKLLGGYRDRIKTCITIGIGTVEESIQQGREFVEQGFRSIKVKGGLSLQEDIERIIRLREVIGDKIELRFDANQGYSVNESLHFIQMTRRADLSLIEQPTPRHELDRMAQVTRKAQIPVMADESLMTCRDAFKLAKRSIADLVNIKIMKVGGITEARHVNSVAYAAGIKAMVGCMDEMALGIAGGLHFALARSNVIYADLDGHLDLIGDPSAGSIILKQGYLYPSPDPGLGIKLKTEF